MSEKTGISWTDHTFNPWWGCTKVSPACDHCYAERDAKRFAPMMALWGVGRERRTFGDEHWKAPMRWAKTMPAKLGRRPRVFCASMGDWLDLDAPLGEFVRLLDLIRRTPELDWLLLSKRVGNCRHRLGEALNASESVSLREWIALWLNDDAPANVWLGATVINQTEADRDIPKLLDVPARVRFLSIEPMLGPITVEHATDLGGPGTIDWVIAGGESGPHARPAHPDWFRALRDECEAFGVPFHFKQWGEHSPGELAPHPSYPGDESAWRVDQIGRRWHDPMESTKLRSEWEPIKFSRPGKKLAGRLLDGRTHDDFPRCHIRA